MSRWPVVDLDEDGEPFDPNDSERRCDPDWAYESSRDDY